MSRNIILKLVVLVIFFVFVGLVVWVYQSRNLYEKQKIEISTVVENVIKEQAKKNMLLPQMVFINANGVDKEKLNDSLIGQITKTLTDKYLKSDLTETSLDISPMVASPFLRDTKGQYYISEGQAEGFKTNIDFLVKQTDIQVASVKEEIGRDIDRLNMWVTIWIGVIGFLGIFIPIVLNMDASGKLEKIQNTANDAKEKIDNAKPQIDKVDTLEEKIRVAECTIQSINGKVGEAQIKAKAANTIATEAEKKSNALHLVYSIDRLEIFNFSQFKAVKKEKIISLLIVVLKRVCQDLKSCVVQCEEDIVKQSLNEMAWRLQEISFMKLIDANTTPKIMEFVKVIDDLMGNYNKDNYEVIIKELDELIVSISDSSKVVA